MQNEADIRVFNPSKEISREITLEILIRHRDAMKQARTGDRIGVEEQPTNARKMNQVRALNLIIAAQREMITNSRPIVVFRASKTWERAFKEEKDRAENPFKEHDNDYNKMMEWLDFLRSCEQAILIADRTPALEDDFIIEKNINGDNVNVLTDNFFEMLEDLEASYEQIYLLMLINKIVSAGIEEDEELSYKEQEAEAVNRIVGA
jgi:hypothetical protein